MNTAHVRQRPYDEALLRREFAVSAAVRCAAIGTAFGGMAWGLPASRLVADDMFAPRSDFDELYTPKVDLAICSGLAKLVERQNEDGSFLSNEGGRNVGICALAGLAMLSRGVRSGIGRAGEALQRVARYVLNNTGESGFINVAGMTSHGPMYEHGFATLFLAELHGTDQQLNIRTKLSAAVELIIRSQNQQGGWRYEPRPADADLSVTVCQVMALRAARNAGIAVPKETIDRAVDYIRRSQNPDGGFMYQLSGGPSRFPLTAAAVVALYNAGIYESSEIDAAVNYLQTNFASSSSLQRDTFFYYAHYYSVQAFWHRGGNEWQQWYSRLTKTIVPMHNAKQGWFDFNSIEYGTAMACLILNMPRSVLPIFQR